MNDPITKCTILALGMAWCLSTASCSADKDYNDGMAEVQMMNGIDVSTGTSLSLAVGMELQVVATPKPENVTDPEIAWTSSNDNVATVSQEGLITAKAVGTANINLSQATAFSTLTTIVVTVKPVATAIALEGTEMYEGTSKQLSVSVTPSEGYDVFTWESDNEQVATVMEDGTVYGQAPGTATITARSTDGSNLVASARVTVKEVIAINEILLEEPGYDLMVGDKTRIACSLDPADATVGLLEWTSDNDQVATVDSEGLVTAKGAGTAAITAKDPVSGTSASVSVTVESEGVVSLSMAYVHSRDELSALGWGFGQTPQSVTFDGEGMTVEMTKQSNGKYRTDLMMASNSHPVTLKVGTYRYLALRMDTPGDGSLKLDTNKGDYGNNPTGRLAEDSQVIYYDLSLKSDFTAVETYELTIFQLKIADVTKEPYSYKVYWVKTFKTLEDLKAYVEKEHK